MKYEVIERRGTQLLIKIDEGNFKRELVEVAKSCACIMKNVIRLQLFNGSFKFYFLSEDSNEIRLILENVDEYTMCNEYLLFQRGMDYFAIKESNLLEVSLGSWFEKGLFLNKTEAGMKVFYFNDDLVEEEYKLLCFQDSDDAIFESLTLSLDGKAQYSILTDLSDSLDYCSGAKKIEGNNHYFETGGIITLYARVDDSSELFIKVHEEKSLITFCNAVLGQDESGVYSLYGFEDCHLVLWGQGTEAEWDGYHVIIGNIRWDCGEVDNWLSMNNPSIIEDEIEQESEPERESLIVSVEVVKRSKISQWWHDIWN